MLRGKNDYFSAFMARGETKWQKKGPNIPIYGDKKGEII